MLHSVHMTQLGTAPEDILSLPYSVPSRCLCKQKICLNALPASYALPLTRRELIGMIQCFLTCLSPCRFIIMEADTNATPWSKICISHADCILLVGTPDTSAEVSHPHLPEASLPVCYQSFSSWE